MPLDLKKYKNILLKSKYGSFLSSPTGKVLRSWVFQGVMYMSRGELIMRVFVEFLLILILFVLWGALEITTLLSIIVIVHLIFWVFNSHFWALEISPGRRLVRNKQQHIRHYLNALQSRVANKDSIAWCLASGSLTRGTFSEWSDLDIVYISEPGFQNHICTYFFALKERLFASVVRIPLELYCHDMETIERITPNEKRLILKAKTCQSGRSENWIGWDLFWKSPPKFFVSSSVSRMED